MPLATSFSVSNRDYHLGPVPYVGICLDGCEDAYLNAALSAGKMPRLAEMIRNGGRTLARGVIPSFTNPNNASIVTGVPPKDHGINGNFFIDPETGDAVMMNDGRYLRTGTILAAAANAGRKVAVVTAKDKLRTILAKGLNGIAFSVERADQATLAEHGLDDAVALIGGAVPKIYSGDASLKVFEAGANLLAAGRADVLYLSTTDYVQHKHAPEDPAALEFYGGIDFWLGRLSELGAVVGLTADHGMNAKVDETGAPAVIYLEPILEALGESEARVILPITDPYVAHHGALGSFAVIHLPPGAEPEGIRRALLLTPGITEVHERAVAAQQFELALDRLGDLIVLSSRGTVLGRSPKAHDLSEVQTGLRSHGGRYEDLVPLILSVPPAAEHRQRFYGDPRNFDLFAMTFAAGAALK